MKAEPAAALVWRWFRFAWAEHQGQLALILSLSVLNAALATAFPWLWQFVVDEVRASAEPVRVNTLGAWMAAVAVANGLLYAVLQWLRTVMNERIQWRARARVFAHLAAVEPGVFRRWRIGDLVTRLTDDSGEKLSWFLCSGVFRAFEAVMVVLTCLLAMVWVDATLTALVVLPLPLLIAAQWLVQGALARRFGAVQSAISQINDQVGTVFEGIRVVQAARLQPTARRVFAERVERQRAAEVRAEVVRQGMFMMYGYGWQLAVVALVLGGGWRVIDGAMSLGELVTFEGFVMTLVWPMFDVGNFLSRYQQAGVALRRLEEVLDEPQTPTHGGSAPRGALALEGVTFAAEDGAVLLDDISLRVEPGRTLAVVGEVGSGKTLLLEVLAGRRHPTAGQVRVGDASLDEVDIAAFRRWSALVPQDAVVLSATVRDNILLGREVDEADLARATRVSRLAADLPRLSAGLDTVVGERGLTLSGGQQQRVALARALVGSPTWLLLDDATSALDADTEAAFWRALGEPTATADTPGLVVVTHRVATIERADNVVVLERGRIVQQGRHSDLVAVDGPYRALYGRMRAAERVAAV